MLPPSLDAASGTLTLRWLAPSGTIDGYQVEGRYGTGTYQQLNSGVLPAATLTLSFTLSPTLPETTDCTFHAKAIRGGDASPYSNEVTYHKPIAPAGQPAGSYDWKAGGAALSWSSLSTVADGFIIKRAECTNAGSILGPWITLQAVTGTSTTYLDTTAKLGTYYLYSITNTKGAEASGESQPSAVVSTQVPSPSQLVGTFDSTRGGVSLTWGSDFTYADGVLLERAAADAVGNAVGGWTALPAPVAGATTLLDTQVQEATNYLYRISNVRGSVDSSPLVAGTFVTVPPATPTGLSAVLDLSQGVPNLAWTAGSVRATAVRIERAEADTSGLPTKPWVGLTVPAGVFTTFTDRSAQEFTRYIYRVTNGFGATWGAASAASPTVTTPLASPSKVVATFDAANNSVQLTWTANTLKATSVIVERAVADANGLPASTWSNLTSYGPVTGYTDNYVTELTSYLYRVTNVASGAPSATSLPSAPLQTPLAPPSYLSAYCYSGQTVTVSWSAASYSSRSYLLSRAESDATGTPTGPWSSLTVPSGYQSNYSDTTGIEGKSYVYRLAFSLNGYTTAYRQMSYPVQIPLMAPTSVVATAKAREVDLTWVNKSTAATQLVVRRSAGSSTYYSPVDVASLPPGTTSYADTNLSLGTYTYVVVAKAGSMEASSTTVTATTPNGTDALTLTGTSLTMANVSDAAVQPAGTWAFAEQSPFGMLSNTGDAWTAYYPDSTSSPGSSLIQMDASGHPHSVYLIPSTSDSSHKVLRHLWHDGTTWQTENLWDGVVPSYSYAPFFQFTLDSTGRPQALVNTSSNYNPTVGAVTYLHYTGGAWKADPLSAAANASQTYSNYGLSLDAADQPHLLFQVGTDAVELLPDGSGGWTSATLSNEALGTYSAGYLQSVWTDAANGWLFYTTATSSYPVQVTLRARQKAAGTWQAPLTLSTQAQSSNYGDPSLKVCTNAARSRILVGCAATTGLKVFHLAAGAWHETLVASPSWFRLGLDSGNRLHVLTQYSSYSATYTDFHE